MTTINVRNFNSIKNTAKSIQPLVTKQNKLKEKIAALQDEIEALNNEIDLWETPVKAMTGGLTSSMLVKRVIEATGDVDKNGNEVKITKWLPTEMVQYDETKKVYIVNEPNGEDENPKEDSSSVVAETVEVAPNPLVPETNVDDPFGFRNSGNPLL